MEPDAFEELYRGYIRSTIRPLQESIDEYFTGWRRESYWANSSSRQGITIPNPVHRYKSRIKRAESILDKVRRSTAAADFPVTEQTLESMHDILGIRIVTYLTDHLTMVDREIRDSKFLEIHPTIKPRWYMSPRVLSEHNLDKSTFEVLMPKPNGYASVHYIVRQKGKSTLSDHWFEIQVRTMLQDVWAELDHQFSYKEQDGKIAESSDLSIKGQLRVIADQLCAVDDHFSLIQGRLTYLQNESKPKNDELLSSANLPSVCGDAQLFLGQRDVIPLLEVLYDNGIWKVKELRKRLNPEVAATMRSYMGSLKPPQPLSAWHAISTAVTLPEKPTNVEIIEGLRIRLSQVEASRERFR